MRLVGKNVWNCNTKFKFLKLITGNTSEYKEIIKFLVTLTTLVIDNFYFITFFPRKKVLFNK